MATESSEGEEDAKLTGGNQLLVVDDDLREMGKKAAWSVSSCKAGNGVSSLRDDNLDSYWQSLLQFPFPFFNPSKYWNLWKPFNFVCLFLACRSDGAQPHLVNIQFQRKVKLQVRLKVSNFQLFKNPKFNFDWWDFIFPPKINFSLLFSMWISSLTRAIRRVRSQSEPATAFTTWR